ncbi:hypothetical protein U724_28050 [Pseudomonas chlororaphis subsp. aurantiaca PB-St2]|nr:hypothetical protein U724_28050 [Pseudomonas chlororaphis subsp. aurantiaca PB-St2]
MGIYLKSVQSMLRWLIGLPRPIAWKNGFLKLEQEFQKDLMGDEVSGTRWVNDSL